MVDNDRRNLMLSALLMPLIAGLPLSAQATDMSDPHHTMPEMGSEMDKVQWMGDEEIAMLVYPGMTAMDLVGPHCMFGSLMGVKIRIVAKTLDPVTSDAGLIIVPTSTFETCPKDLTVLFTPGGTDGTLAAAADPETLAFFSDRCSRARYVTSV